ncbi:MAG: DUF1003 domain-containing protein [Patescibacteria group bacterium]|jgi:uncharacterized membrane protein
MALHPQKVYSEKLTGSEKLAIKIAKFTGNMSFVWWHAFLFVLWIILNLIAFERAWDPYPFNLLTMIVSLEAIFLSTFVLIAENREAKRNEIREELDYQVNVKAEKEIQELQHKIDELIRLQKKGK